MRRNLDTLRAILLGAADAVPLAGVTGVAPQVFAYHVSLLAQMGSIKSLWLPGGGAQVVSLTAQGHEEAECLRGERDWSRVMAHFRGHGSPEGCGVWELAIEWMKEWKRLSPEPTARDRRSRSRRRSRRRS